MLQRSPTYVVSLPTEDTLSASLRKVLPSGTVYRLARARNITIQRAFYLLTRVQPDIARKAVLAAVKRQIGPDIDMRHFTPDYNPWDQRLCVVPNGDLFKALRHGTASIATDHIETFTETGIRLKSGEEIPADIIVTATGLAVQMLGGVQVEVDGAPVHANEKVIYKGVMLDGVPNAVMVIGYTNASWTLKADIAAEYFCRAGQPHEGQGLHRGRRPGTAERPRRRVGDGRLAHVGLHPAG